MLSGGQSRALHSSRQIQLPKVTELGVVKLHSCLEAKVMAEGETLKPGSLPGFKSWLCPLLAGKPWVIYFTSLCLSFTNFTMEENNSLSVTGSCQDKCMCLELCLLVCKCELLHELIMACTTPSQI